MCDLSDIVEVYYHCYEKDVNYLLKHGWILLKVTQESDGYASGRGYVLGRKRESYGYIPDEDAEEKLIDD